MSVVANHLSTSFNDSSASSFNTASVTPSANRLILLAVSSQRAAGNPNIPSISGNGLTWTQVATILSSDTLTRITIFRAMSPSAPSTGVITISFSGQSQDFCYWSLSDFSGVRTSGSNGANAVVQSATNEVSGTTTGLTVTLASFGSASNATYGAMHAVSGNPSGFAQGSGFSVLGNTTTGLNKINTEFKNSNDTTVDWTWTSQSLGAYGIALEIAAEISSPSASLSPSASSSPSLSPSSSVSASISPSASRSPSASLSPSASISPSASSSRSLSPSASSSASTSPSPSQGYIAYSRGDEHALPAGINDLETPYSEADEANVSSRNDIGVTQDGALQYMMHQFKVFVGEVPEVQIEWEGHSSLAPKLSAVYLQVFNLTSGLWETVDVNNSARANIDFELEEKIHDVTDYRDSQNIVTCRVYQLAL